MSRSRSRPADFIVGKNIRIYRIRAQFSQTALAERIGVTFQQVQKYEKGTNRIGASRLQQISQILQVPVPFFFDGAPGQSGAIVEIAESDLYVSDFLATSDGLALVKAFMCIEDAKLRRAVVRLVEEIVPETL